METLYQPLARVGLSANYGINHTPLRFFFIADTHATPILGFDSCRAMGLVTIENRVLKMSHTEVAAVKIEPKLPRHDLEDSVRVHETLTTSDLSEEVGVFEILHTAVTDARIEKVRAAMKHDQSMQILIRTIPPGWPNGRRRCPKQIQDF